MRSRLLSQVDPVDLVLAFGLTLAMQAEIWAPEYFGADSALTNRPLLSATSLLISLPVAFRRSQPWPVAILALGAEVVQSTLATPSDGLANLLAMLIVAYSLGRYTRPPPAYAGLLMIAVTSFLVGSDLADDLFVLMVMGAAWGAGLVVAGRTADLGALELRRLEATRAGAEEERLRIARELHDVVAHRVSLMVVQSQLADSLVDRDPQAARAAVNAIESTGREAMDELRSVLGLLHDGTKATRSPEDTDLSRLGALVDDARAGGLDTALHIVGTPRPVAPVVALATFRIVQESLTNVVKHAGPVDARVQLTYCPDSIEVIVENEGPVIDQHVAGHGISGMTERASFVGGSLTSQPRESGGFRVAAVLPTPEVRT